MKTLNLVSLTLWGALSLIGCEYAGPSSVTVPAASTSPAWQVCFSPRGGCTQLIVETIASARASVLVQAYSFTSRPIAQALIDAHRRGVHVEAILDDSQRRERQSLASRLAQAAIPVFIDAQHRIAHNKVMIIDGDTVITGSFNFTRAAEESNAENLLVIRDRPLAQRYQENWRLHRIHAAPFTGSSARGARR